MSSPSRPALRILTLILAIDAIAKGLVMIFGGKAVMTRLFPYPPESEITTLLLLTRQQLGAQDLALGLMLYFAFRDPVRNVAVLYGIVLGLCIAAVTSVISLSTLDAGRLYPPYSIWAHSLLRLAVATLLYCLRPRDAIFARLQGGTSGVSN